MCDASYKFTYFDLGAYGSEGDAGIFHNSTFGEGVLNEKLPFPKNTTVNGTKLPFVFVGDDAFPLTKRIMKPFSLKRKLSKEEIIFNYRLSRARRCIENTFGIMSSKWQCLKRTMFCRPERAQKIAAACCYLHNYLIQEKVNEYCPPNFADRLDIEGNLVEGEWRKKVSDNSILYSSLENSTQRPSKYEKQIRNTLMDYFNSKLGEVPWQSKITYTE